MFPKLESTVIEDKFNKKQSYSVNIGKHINPKRVFKYRTIVYHHGESFLSYKECKNFKTYEEAKGFYDKLVHKYEGVGKVLKGSKVEVFKKGKDLSSFM